MKKTLLLFFAFILISSCEKQTTSVKDLKDNETVVSKVDSFHTITNNSLVNIEISNEVPKDEVHLISTKENLEKIKYEIVDGELIFSQKSKSLSLKNNTQIIAKINSENISKFKISGAGYIKSLIIQKSESIETEIQGAGNLELMINNNSISNKIEGFGNISLKGRTNISKTEIEGAGNLDAFELETNITTVSIEGVGNANVNASEKIDANISGVGNLTYKGNPKEIIKSKSGLGSINQK